MCEEQEDGRMKMDENKGKNITLIEVLFLVKMFLTFYIYTKRNRDLHNFSDEHKPMPHKNKEKYRFTSLLNLIG